MLLVEAESQAFFKARQMFRCQYTAILHDGDAFGQLCASGAGRAIRRDLDLIPCKRSGASASAQKLSHGLRCDAGHTVCDPQGFAVNFRLFTLPITRFLNTLLSQ